MAEEKIKITHIRRMYEYYQCGASLQKVGDKFGLSKQLVHYYFKALKFKTRKRRKSEPKIIMCDGLAFYEGPDGQYRHRRKKCSYLLHHYLWCLHFGEIPKNKVVSFKNGDKTDFSLSNLILMNRGFNLKQRKKS